MSNRNFGQDTLAKARRLAKQLERQKRTDLRGRMRGSARVSIVNMQTGESRIYRYGDYDSPVTMVPSTDYNPFHKDSLQNTSERKTIHDISQELQNTLSHAKHTNAIRHNKREDVILSEVVCDEVKNVWKTKLSLHQTLDDVSRAKLQQTRNLIDTTKPQADITRELRMTALARSFVYRYCDAEGYDPDLHTLELREKFNEYVRSNL
jgi:hypothetical protein